METDRQPEIVTPEMKDRENPGVISVITIFWKSTTPPDGEYYLPAEATLVRK